jgi:hypothetical protein
MEFSISNNIWGFQESSVAAGLQEEVKEARRKCSETSDKLGIRIQTLTRENELLKHQLKKYVGAVQKLRDGPMAYETVRPPKVKPKA